VDDIETAVMTLTMRDDSNTAHVTSTSSHGDHRGIKADEVGDFAVRKVDLDRIVDLD